MTIIDNLDTFLSSWNEIVPDQLKVTSSNSEVTTNNLYRLLADRITYWSPDQYEYVLLESGINNDEVQGRAWTLSIKGDDIFQIAVTNSCTETQLAGDGTVIRYWVSCDKFYIWINMEYIDSLRKNMQ